MLTPYDEFPVHQHSRPFSVIPVTDPSWDDGYFFGVYNPDAKVFLYTGMRFNPNTDIVGGYAGIMVDGVQHTLRVSRIWRPKFEVAIGPLSYDFVEPMKRIALKLEANDSDLTFDLEWIAVAPAHEEAHHCAWSGQRMTTDQTRYTQSGTARGTIRFRGQTWTVEEATWAGDRDHSWGLYRSRDPLRIPPRFLPPVQQSGARRAMRFWLPFVTSSFSGFYHFHEDENGSQTSFNDVFGSPFEGQVVYGFSGKSIRFVSASHKLEFFPGTRAVMAGLIELTDENGDKWTQEIEAADMPWQSFAIGYNGGSWKDGGNIGSYHGEGVYQEFDEFDLSRQPFDIDDYLGRRRMRWGNEYVVHVRTSGPDGQCKGVGHLETFFEGTYRPYGFGLEDTGANYSQG
jgi:hypothetical protein